VKNGGAAILLDNFNMKLDCTRYIELEWTS
jgi:hypothetical protein